MQIFGFAAVAEHEGLLPKSDGIDCPFSVHGAFSNYDDTLSIGVSDYQSFPNMSGAAVMCQGQLFGIHLAA